MKSRELASSDPDSRWGFKFTDGVCASTDGFGRHYAGQGNDFVAGIRTLRRPVCRNCMSWPQGPPLHLKPHTLWRTALVHVMLTYKLQMHKRGRYQKILQFGDCGSYVTGLRRRPALNRPLGVLPEETDDSRSHVPGAW